MNTRALPVAVHSEAPPYQMLIFVTNCLHTGSATEVSFPLLAGHLVCVASARHGVWRGKRRSNQPLVTRVGPGVTVASDTQP